ncbi:MAG: hypothetical protein PHP07_00255 [Eubacteriales bacterium]|jgi:hypothetical protein|nr:hypothetical protein [Eubacteriales bacterium]MDD3571366.1 hypothetical protein [Eubacteriales bacterium]MDD4133531.1 hypothetical protein [Eubacteriales bacterium]
MAEKKGTAQKTESGQGKPGKTADSKKMGSGSKSASSKSSTIKENTMPGGGKSGTSRQSTKKTASKASSGRKTKPPQEETVYDGLGEFALDKGKEMISDLLEGIMKSAEKLGKN